jgi:rieske iron-sulfur protein
METPEPGEPLKFATPNEVERHTACPSRRAVMCGLCAAATLGIAGRAGAAGPAEAAKDKLAQPGDKFASFDYHTGRAGKTIIEAAEVKRGAQPFLAWPYDVKDKIARDGSHLNLVLFMRFDPASLSPHERARAADGLVCYTAVCTHQACWITDYNTAKQVLECRCHGSEYNLRQGGEVVLGPAPRALPALPIRVAEGKPVVAGPFTDRVGGESTTG